MLSKGFLEPLFDLEMPQKGLVGVLDLFRQPVPSVGVLQDPERVVDFGRQDYGSACAWIDASIRGSRTTVEPPGDPVPE